MISQVTKPMQVNPRASGCADRHSLDINTQVPPGKTHLHASLASWEGFETLEYKNLPVVDCVSGNLSISKRNLCIYIISRELRSAQPDARVVIGPVYTIPVSFELGTILFRVYLAFRRSDFRSRIKNRYALNQSGIEPIPSFTCLHEAVFYSFVRYRTGCVSKTQRPIA